MEPVPFRSGDARLWGAAYRTTDSRARTTVVMSHGLTNHHDDAPMFMLLRDMLVEDGFDVFMFDYFGSGESDGLFHDKTFSIMRHNLGTALDVAADIVPANHLALVGRSVGASIAAFYLTDPRVDCAVLASPVLHLVDRFASIRTDRRLRFVEMPEWLERSGQIKGAWELNQMFFEELAPTEQGIALAVEGATGVMVLQGLMDGKVSARNAEGVFDLLAEPRKLDLLEGADHYYTGMEKMVSQKCVTWLKNHSGFGSHAGPLDGRGRTRE